MNTVSISRKTHIALITLGRLINSERKNRKLSQTNLAERLNVSRFTVMAIEKGEPQVAIGTVFEAATIVGLNLLANDIETLRKISSAITQFDAILPKRIRKKNETIDDNF